MAAAMGNTASRQIAMTGKEYVMEDSFIRNVIRQIPWIILAAIVGAAVFIFVQRWAFGADVAAFIGAQIVAQGQYSPSLQNLFGWGVHSGVSLSYAALYGVLMALPFFPQSQGRWSAGFLLGIILGWLTTLITEPAIAATISVLARQGWPAELGSLNVGFGLPFWNHMGFFAICWLSIVVLADLVRHR